MCIDTYFLDGSLKVLAGLVSTWPGSSHHKVQENSRGRWARLMDEVAGQQY